jgi:O-antigen/teichoic acid export membrane protein
MRWGSRGAFAILDQGLFAGSNFIANIMLARWLSSENYGIFAVVYSIFLLLGTFHAAVLTAPMLVFGATSNVQEFRAYIGVLLRGHIAITVAMSLIITAAASIFWALGSIALAKALFGLALGTPFILLLWLARSACYVCFRPLWAATAGALYLVLLAAMMYGLDRSKHLSPASALIVMGLTGLIAGVALLVRLRPQWRTGSTRSMLSELGGAVVLLGLGRTGNGNSPIDWGQSGSGRAGDHAHARYARWSLAAAIASWVEGNAQYFVLSATAGLASVAAMRVLDTMLLPFWHAQFALSRLLTPALGARVQDPRSELFPVAISVSLLWGALGAIAYLLARSLGVPTTALLYGSGYSKYSHLLAWYGLILIPGMVGEASYSLFRAVQRIDLVFVYTSLLAVAALTAFLGAARYGLPGIVVARIGVAYLLWPFVMFSLRAVCVSSAAPRSP